MSLLQIFKVPVDTVLLFDETEFGYPAGQCDGRIKIKGILFGCCSRSFRLWQPPTNFSCTRTASGEAGQKNAISIYCGFMYFSLDFSNRRKCQCLSSPHSDFQAAKEHRHRDTPHRTAMSKNDCFLNLLFHGTFQQLTHHWHSLNWLRLTGVARIANRKWKRKRTSHYAYWALGRVRCQITRRTSTEFQSASSNTKRRPLLERLWKLLRLALHKVGNWFKNWEIIPDDL